MWIIIMRTKLLFRCLFYIYYLFILFYTFWTILKLFKFVLIILSSHIPVA